MSIVGRIMAISYSRGSDECFGGRMTLLLGPPGSGKTTLMLALAAKLDPELKVEGTVTYNGHRLDEFVPQRTSSYISQHDLHLPELTVRETLDFSARCQGVGTRYGKSRYSQSMAPSNHGNHLTRAEL